MAIRDVAGKIIHAIRGLFYRADFDKASLVQITGQIKVIKRNGRIEIGKCIIWGGAKLSVCGSARKEAVLTIGDYSTIGDRTEIHVGEKVAIGKGVRVSWDCVIMDRDYHGLEGRSERVSPVIIGDGAWIGCRSIILPGVTIGEGSVIGAGSVVTKNIPPGTVAAGNPARIIRELEKK